jgi:hypothetical protein
MKTMIRRSMLVGAFCSLPLLAQYSQPIHDVDNSARQPYTDGTQFSGGFVNLTTVPAGKRLVIESISFEAFLPTGHLAYLRVGTVQSGVFSNVYSVVPGVKLLSSTVTVDYVGNSVPLKMYVNPGAALSVTFQNNFNDPLTTVTLMVSGYYVNLP